MLFTINLLIFSSETVIVIVKFYSQMSNIFFTKIETTWVVHEFYFTTVIHTQLFYAIPGGVMVTEL